MSNGYNKLHGSVKATGNVMEAFDAFKSNSANGVFEKEDFLRFMRGLRTEDYEHTDNLFKCLKERLRMTNSLRLRKDRGDNLYYWGEFARVNGNEGVKIIGHPSILELIKLYRDGKVQIAFTLEDLIDEALSTVLSID